MGLVPLDEAERFVLDRCPPLDPVDVPLSGALGLVTRQPYIAREAVPPFDNSAMDGFAVRAADVTGADDHSPSRLQVVGEVLAGHAPQVDVSAGEAVRIMTGAPMPSGADAVVMVERTAMTDDRTVEVHGAVTAGTNVRLAGDDMRAGDEVVAAGVEITPAVVGVLATIGVTSVSVAPRPRVGVLSTGDELVEGAVDLEPGQIRDSNRPALLALVGASACEAVDLGHVEDDEAAITEAFVQGVERCDAIVTSGGVSMGEVDLVKVVLDRLGEMRWMQVAIRPAKPFAFGLLERERASDGGASGGRVPVFGLPGNPVSSLVSFELLARPALRQMLGHPPERLHRPRVTAIVDETLARHPDGKTHFARVVCRLAEDGLFHLASAGGQGSHQMRAMALANALAVLPDGGSVEPGSVVDVLLLGDVVVSR